MFKTKLDAALGKTPADLVLKNAKVICTYTEEIIDADVAILDDVIVGVGKGYEGKKEVDLKGKYLSPGFIDSHLHIESSMGTPERLAEAVIPWGTTTLIADPHELANVKGIDAVRYVIEAGKELPLSLYVMAPSCVPATPEEENGAVFSAEDLAELKDEPYLLGLGEMMDFNGVISGNEEICKKLSAFSNKVIDGHAPLVTGKVMQAYRLAGVATDHECATEKEVIEKLRAGFYINIRESSAAKNVETICEVAAHMGIKYLTFYAFSTENWNRPDSEVSALMSLLENYLKTCMKTAKKNNIRVRILGDISRLDTSFQKQIKELEDFSKEFDGLNLQIAINYGSRDEMVRGMRKMAEKITDGTLKPEDITEDLFEGFLDTAGIPDPDLLIRTCGEQRLSNYLLWQLAYSEFYFTEVPWPDFDKAELEKAVDAYRKRNRRFGGLSEE